RTRATTLRVSRPHAGFLDENAAVQLELRNHKLGQILGLHYLVGVAIGEVVADGQLGSYRARREGRHPDVALAHLLHQGL
nr:hypothetical protein [Tanacetum cinerariifolium]